MDMIREFAPYVFALITALAVAKLADKGSKRGQDASTVIETKRVDLDGRKVDLEVLTESILNLRTDQAESKVRITDLEDELKHEKDQRKLSNAFARTLAQVLRAEGIAVPAQPVGLDLD